MEKDLKQVFDFIRCSKDKDRLRDLVQKDEAFHLIRRGCQEVYKQFFERKSAIARP